TVLSSYFFPGPDHNRPRNRSFLHLAGRQCRLHGNHNFITDRGVTLPGPAQHMHTKDLLCSAIIGYSKSGFGTYHDALYLSLVFPFFTCPQHQHIHTLTHFAFSTISTSLQRLSLLSGRVSMMRTVSPMPA